jgi:hypothetical protein
MAIRTNPATIDSLLHTLYSMAFLVEARDPYTGGHLWRVSQFSARLALASGFSHREAAAAALGGFLHDLGKVGVPDAILTKKGLLTGAEYAIVKTHPSLGAQVLQGHPLAPVIHDALLGHHERIDGRGYPAGLADDAIAPIIKIVSLADAFDAMTSTRPYRSGMPVEAALEQIALHLDKQFDRALGKRLIALGRTGELNAIVGHSDAGIPLHNCPMCGPVVAIRKAQKTGDSVFCRVCGSGFKLLKDQDKLQLKLEPTGHAGTADDLQADIDHDLTKRLIADIAPHVTLPGKTVEGGWRERIRRWRQ